MELQLFFIGFFVQPVQPFSPAFPCFQQLFPLLLGAARYQPYFYYEKASMLESPASVQSSRRAI